MRFVGERGVHMGRSNVLTHMPMRDKSPLNFYVWVKQSGLELCVSLSGLRVVIDLVLDGGRIMVPTIERHACFRMLISDHTIICASLWLCMSTHSSGCNNIKQHMRFQGAQLVACSRLPPADLW